MGDPRKHIDASDSKSVSYDDRTVPRRGGAEARTKVFSLRETTERPAHPIPNVAPHRFTVGKSPSCDLALDDPEVSRRHLALEAQGAVLHLEDLGSTNGTHVNGVRVGTAYLQGGEMLRLGATTLLVEASDAAAPRTSSAICFGRVMGSSRQMRSLYAFCERLANRDINVVIEGETGTGKELLAESLHERGSRASGPFVVFDCTTVSRNLVEAALFGFERGAFTGAESTQPGVFERAEGGTLFIDEIGDLDLDLQAKLLRAVERSEVRRIGGNRLFKVDVRIICATRRDLERAIQENRFRDDLYHRLTVARIELPPLRKREGDVELLAQYFWSNLGGGEMPSGFLESLSLHPWPGNVRELHNLVARTIALGDLDVPKFEVGDEDVITAILKADLPFVRARDQVMEEFLRMYVERALSRHGGSVPDAAASAGVSRRYFDKIRARIK